MKLFVYYLFVLCVLYLNEPGLKVRFVVQTWLEEGYFIQLMKECLTVLS